MSDCVRNVSIRQNMVGYCIEIVFHIQEERVKKNKNTMQLPCDWHVVGMVYLM